MHTRVPGVTNVVTHAISAGNTQDSQGSQGCLSSTVSKRRFFRADVGAFTVKDNLQPLLFSLTTVDDSHLSRYTIMGLIVIVTRLFFSEVLISFMVMGSFSTSQGENNLSNVAEIVFLVTVGTQYTQHVTDCI